jgi:hypothetical protein
MTGRRQREFTPLPPGVVKVRLEGTSSAHLCAALANLPGVAVVTGPDIYYPGPRYYLTVAVLGEDQAKALPGGGA